MMRKGILLLIIAGFSTLIDAAAQTKLLFSVDSAQMYAVKNNKQTENARLAVDEARHRVRETFAAGLPQADLSVDYSYFFNYKLVVARQSKRYNP